MTRFSPAPKSPNCVSSRAPDSDAGHAIAPLANTTLAQVRAVMAQRPRTTLAEEADGYLRYVETTRIMRFKDDIEFEQDGDDVHVRSASRVGYSDMGLNRKRVEQIRQALR